MARKKSKAVKYVEHLMDVGYEAKDIAKISGIPRSTVYNIVDKLKKEARRDFEELMEKDYLYKYQNNLSNYSKTIRECNEKIEQVNHEYDELERIAKQALEEVEPNKHVSKSNFLANLITINTNRANDLARLVQQRDKASELKAKLFNQGPVVYRINEYVKQNSGVGAKSVYHPMMDKEGEENQVLPELQKVEEKSVLQEPPMPEKMTISEEDIQTLREMEEDNID